MENQSVFQKHKHELEVYEITGVEMGRLLFALAVLSDCQEMTDLEAVRGEITEVKELIVSVMNIIKTKEIQILNCKSKVTRQELIDALREFLSISYDTDDPFYEEISEAVESGADLLRRIDEESQISE
jgi:hypothetical protein